MKLMKKNLLFLFAVLLSLLPQAMLADTWTFEWNASKKDGGQGFYNFGTGAVDKDVYTAELNGLQWNISAEGTHVYAYTSTMGQYIGKASEPPTSVKLWTESLAGNVKAVRVTARVQKDTYEGNMSVTVNGKSYLHGEATTAALTGTLAEYEFKVSEAEAQEGKVEIDLQQTSDSKGPLYIKKIEIDYEKVASSVLPPVFTPAAGTYDEAQTVTIQSEAATNVVRTIYYTTDGSNPKLEGGTRQVYTAPIDVTATTTFKAVVLEGDEYSDVVVAKYVIRKDPQLSFYKQNITLTSGDEGYADLLNPNKLSPITYKSSQWDVCSVDDKGLLATSYVTYTQTVIITASFAGNDEYKPGEAKMFVTVEAKQPLKTPVVTPMGGTFDAPVDVTVSTDDENAVTIWYSTTAKDSTEFDEDYTKSTVVEGKTVTFTVNKTCTLYVMTRGYNQNSKVVTAQFTINEPLKADFTTDKALTAYYDQEFDSAEGMADWTVGTGWKLANKNFKAIKADDVASVAITYDAGSGNSLLVSPELTVEEGSSVEFYAYFQAPYLIFGKWTFDITDTEQGQSTTLLNAFDWAQDNAYTGPNWNKFSFDLSAYAGKKVKFEFDYPFGGENLAIDGFRLIKDDAAAAEEIHIFEGESIEFRSTAKGQPETLEWAFPGAETETSTETNPVVKYNKAGTYSVSLTVRRGEESDKMERNNFVVVAQKAPTALIGLPEEGYESPWVGVFVPTDVPVTFRDLSTGNPTEWKWVFQFADKETSTEQNPTVTFVKKGTVSVGLTAKNAAGQSNDILQYAIQAGGAQYVWNINSEENKSLEKISLGYFGNYAGSNWLGIDKFAEKYKAPLADATIEKATVYFASVTANDKDYPINLTVNAVAENGEPGEVLASASVKAADLQYSETDYLPTTFVFDKAVKLKAGEEFFVVVGPFPNTSLDVSPYTSDDISIFCLRRGVGNKNTAWQYLEDQDQNGNGLGTFKWLAQTDDPTSIAIAPCIEYADKTDGIENVDTSKATGLKIVSAYTLSGQAVDNPRRGEMYIVKFSDGSCRKIVWNK
ncbi:MAG TPA: hypothetical protein DEQ27_02035 [Prevotella sp.]|nr:hypothetical protein [Prevotella sp.]